MKTSTNYFSGFNRNELQRKFIFNFENLENSNEENIDYIQQCHFGDMLIQQVEPTEGERFKLWRKLDTNGGGILIEYCGNVNGWKWETVYES